MRHRAFIFLLIISTALFADESVLTQKNIQITCPTGREQLARFTLNTIQNLKPQLHQMFGASSKNIQIVIVDRQADFQRYAGMHLPQWTAAVTISPRNIIILKSPNLTNSTLRQYRVSVRHECIHLYQGFHTPLHITPTWYNEGLATYFTDPYNVQSRIILSRAIINDSLIPLRQLSDFLKYNHIQAELAYAESSALIEFLVVVFGEPIIRSLTDDIKTTRDFENSLYRLTDIEPGTLEFHWKKYISHRYRWIFLMDIHYLIWLIIPLLVLIAFFMKKHRNKKIIHQWNVEETEQSITITK
jgi:hypothetical protein